MSNFPRFAAPAIIPVALVAVLATPASADISAILVQHADSARVTAGQGDAMTITMESGASPVLTLEERPGRRVSKIPQKRAVALWQSTFAQSPPNAVLVGTTVAGTTRRIVVELTSARSVRDGVSYRASLLSGRPASRLTDATLLIDGIPAADAGFPSTTASATPPSLTVTSNSPATISATSAENFSSVTIEQGGTLTFDGRVALVAGTSLNGVTPPTCGAVSALGGAVSQESPAVASQPATCWVTLTSASGSITVTNSNQDPVVLQDVSFRVS